MKKTFYIFYFCFFALLSLSAQQLKTKVDPKVLRFRFNQGDKSRILSTVNEDVFLNGNFHHSSVIINRISSEITDVKGDGSGFCKAIFMTSEDTSHSWNGKNYTWGEEYESYFYREPSGKYSIEDIYFMPTVRDVPVFPSVEVIPGDTWVREGYEAHDMRRSFGLEKPFKFPFDAHYEYKGDYIDKNGNELSLIEINYNMYFESPNLQDEQLSYNENILSAPKLTKGYSHQKVWFNNDRGAIDHYTEDFRIQIQTYSGDEITFTGTAHAEIIDFERSSTKENLQKVTKTVAEYGLENVDVKESENGLTISIENIQFEPDSAVLMESEKFKLKKIAEILKTFDNDLLITGHCAKRGSVKNQLRISEERAASVANFLTEQKVRNPSCIFTKGRGAEEPVATNATEAGRARNRRVEITIMDK